MTSGGVGWGGVGLSLRKLHRYPKSTGGLNFFIFR